MTEAAIRAGMSGTTNAEVNGMISSGLDWPSQVAAIARSGVVATVYSTWLDAPTQANTVQGEAPIAYLAELAARYGLPVAGENTGGGGPAALALSLQRRDAYGLTGVMYMSGNQIASGTAHLSLDELQGAVRADAAG
jgi:hypothetical protein